MTLWRVSPTMYRLCSVALLAAVLLMALACTVRDASHEGALAADATSLKALVEVMGQRLAVMPQVAEWKRVHDRPVRDRPRELVVLDEAVKAVDAAAQKAGVKPFPEDAVRRFYQAQIDTAVAIQEKILSEPPKTHAKPPDLTTVIRPELDRLGARIANLLVVQPEAPGRPRLERLARRYWKVEGLEPDAVTNLVDALERLLTTPDPASLDMARSAPNLLEREESSVLSEEGQERGPNPPAPGIGNRHLAEPSASGAGLSD